MAFGALILLTEYGKTVNAIFRKMGEYNLPLLEGELLKIVDYEIDLQASPPEITESVIDKEYVFEATNALKMVYGDGPITEGQLNVFICEFKNGKCKLHVSGKIAGREIRAVRELPEEMKENLDIINERIKYVLVSSRHVLRKYYLGANSKSIEDHLMAFLIPS